MPVRRTLGFFGALRGMTRGDAERAALPWLERVGLADRADQPVKTLSKGNQQKVQFVAAVLHRPRVAFLDEPFSGLDPVNQDLFTTLIRELREGGTTVVFSAHQMPLVERLADRIFLVARGRCVLEGTVAELRSRWHAGERLVLGVAAGDPRVLLAHPAVEAVEEGRAAGEVRLRLRDGIGMAGLLGMIDERLTVTSLRTEAVSLHDIYVQAVGGEAAGAPPEMPRGGGSPPSPLAEHAILPPSIPTPDARPTAAGAR
jgi:ABC-2 type transport system ATP-binding protein